MSEALANAVRMMVTRAKVVSSALAARTLLQVTRFATENFQSVELLVPPGYCARPVDGADVVILHIGGLGDHKVAIGGDNTADRQADLLPGEYGLASNGQRVILRQNRIEITSGQPIVINSGVSVTIQAPSLLWTPDGVTYYPLATSAHLHDVEGSVTTAPLSTPAGALT